MKKNYLLKIRPYCLFLILSAVLFLPQTIIAQVGKTAITRWQYNKRTAVSLTYDDGSRNQFRYALPVMEELHFPATFFIITGVIEGSAYKPKFVGRPVEQIIAESGRIATDKNNFFERASASLYLGYQGALPFYNRADELYESGHAGAAYEVLDSLFLKIKNKELLPGKDTSMEMEQEMGLSWQQVKDYATRGYEFASHTVSHAHLAILDSANMNYELKKSKEDILNHIGKQYTFSAEIPFGIEDKRVMKFGFPVYNALRNAMPEPWMDEINRGYKQSPGNSSKEYVQWQRGPLSHTSYELMKSWIDTAAAHNNIWLVLVFHGVDDVGWEPLSHERLHEYFTYLKSKQNDIWVARFGDVARYLRERMNANVAVKNRNGKIIVKLSHQLDPALYNLPLTLKTSVPDDWKTVMVQQGAMTQVLHSEQNKSGRYILYQGQPNGMEIRLSKK